MAKRQPAAPAAKSPSNRPDVANTPRQSAVAFADYINTLNQHAPEQLADIVDPSTVKAALAAIEAAGDRYTSTTAAAIATAIKNKVEAAVKALTNDAPLTGYAGYSFDPEVFAAKVAPKKGRSKLSDEDRMARVAEQATPEQLEILAALLREKGLGALGEA